MTISSIALIICIFSSALYILLALTAHPVAARISDLAKWFAIVSLAAWYLGK